MDEKPVDKAVTDVMPPMPTMPRSKFALKVSKRTVTLFALSVVAVAGWAAFGVATSNLSGSLTKAQTRIAALESHSASVEDNLSRVSDERDALASDAKEVEARDAELTTRESAVTAREEAISEKEDIQKATTLLDGQYYTVGLSMKSGKYQAKSSSSDCYWSITRSGTNYGDIVDNDLGAMGVLTVTVRSGQDFQSHDCGDWIKVG